MTDNARIVREALEHFRANAFDGYGNPMPGYSSQALAALTALETELAKAKEEARINLASAHTESIDRDAMLRRAQKAETELSDLKADLERAREALVEEVRIQCVIAADKERERIIAVLQKEGGEFFRGRTGRWGDGYIEAAELRGLLTRAAMAPEQKG